MNIFWHEIILPMLHKFRPKRIVEVGALYGQVTTRLMEHFKHGNEEIFVIDPAPAFDVQALQAAYGNKFHMFNDYSLNVLPKFDDYDFVLIDGDHNWYTVYHELKTIEAMAKQRGSNFPVVLCHDTEWPYGRRDMYYFPETIPEQYRKPYARMGIVPGRSELVEGGVNGGSCHAIYEHGERNGILTAIEDFLKETELEISLHRIVPHHGLGILLPKTDDNDRFMKELISKSGF